MKALSWIAGGLIGGAIGAAIWVAIGYTTQYELGWIAWGIGFLVGVGVRYAAHLSDQEESFAQGAVAAGIALGSVVLAKYLVVVLLTGGVADQLQLAQSMVEFDDANMISAYADEEVKLMAVQGKTVRWPPGMTFEDASEQEDYPPEVWHAAETRWNALNPEQKEQAKQQKKEEFQTHLATIESELTSRAFEESISPWDLLWLGLATVTAFRIGVGSYGDD